MVGACCARRAAFALVSTDHWQYFVMAIMFSS
jgi:hypothetical protein